MRTKYAYEMVDDSKISLNNVKWVVENRKKYKTEGGRCHLIINEMQRKYPKKDMYISSLNQDYDTIVNSCMNNPYINKYDLAFLTDKTSEQQEVVPISNDAYFIEDNIGQKIPYGMKGQPFDYRQAWIEFIKDSKFEFIQLLRDKIILPSEEYNKQVGNHIGRINDKINRTTYNHKYAALRNFILSIVFLAVFTFASFFKYFVNDSYRYGYKGLFPWLQNIVSNGYTVDGYGSTRDIAKAGSMLSPQVYFWLSIIGLMIMLFILVAQMISFFKGKKAIKKCKEALNRHRAYMLQFEDMKKVGNLVREEKIVENAGQDFRQASIRNKVLQLKAYQQTIDKVEGKYFTFGDKYLSLKKAFIILGIILTIISFRVCG